MNIKKNSRPAKLRYKKPNKKLNVRPLTACTGENFPMLTP